MMNTTLRPAKALVLAALFLPTPGLALDIAVPSGAEKTTELRRNPDVYPLPTGPWTPDGGLPVVAVEGAILAQAWKVPGTGLTPFQMVKPLRDQIEEAGYRVVLDCAADQCGGFDFRFATRVLPAPAMFVNLTDYHFLAAQHPEGDAVSVLTSQSGLGGHIQIIRAGQGETGETSTTGAALRTAVTSDVGLALETQGHVVLSDMVFASGSSDLDGAVASLDDIAAYLKANPSRRILFVGHTDAVGSPEANRALSKRRAGSAVTYLQDRHGIPAAQIAADGVGFLSPVASNLTPEGREANRRVEAVLVSTQ